jgi:hypothetical protein
MKRMSSLPFAQPPLDVRLIIRTNEMEMTNIEDIGSDEKGTTGEFTQL